MWHLCHLCIINYINATYRFSELTCKYHLCNLWCINCINATYVFSELMLFDISNCIIDVSYLSVYIAWCYLTLQIAPLKWIYMNIICFLLFVYELAAHQRALSALSELIKTSNSYMKHTYMPYIHKCFFSITRIFKFFSNSLNH